MSICLRGGKRGFTLVEVMVSLMIFLVTSMGLLPLLMTNMQVNYGNSQRAQAQRLTGEQMAQLQVADYTALATIADGPFMVSGVELQQQVEQDTPQPGQSRLTVTARWYQQGRSHRYQLETVRSAP